MKIVMLAAAGLILAGCGFYHWHKEGADAAAFQRDVGNVAPLACDKAAILAHPAIGGNEFERRYSLAHAQPPCGAFAFRRRSAANSTASTICP